MHENVSRHGDLPAIEKSSAAGATEILVAPPGQHIFSSYPIPPMLIGLQVSFNSQHPNN